MAPNRKRVEREISDAVNQSHYIQGYNLISEEDVKFIKSKLSQPGRTEEDWTSIKDRLCERNLITMEVSGYVSMESVLVDRGSLIAFTNPIDCRSYLKFVENESGERNCEVRYHMIAFYDAARVADSYDMTLLIDIIPENWTNMFMSYSHERIEVVKLLPEEE